MYQCIPDFSHVAYFIFFQTLQNFFSGATYSKGILRQTTDYILFRNRADLNTVAHLSSMIFRDAKFLTRVFTFLETNAPNCRQVRVDCHAGSPLHSSMSCFCSLTSNVRIDKLDVSSSPSSAPAKRGVSAALLPRLPPICSRSPRPCLLPPSSYFFARSLPCYPRLLTVVSRKSVPWKLLESTNTRHRKTTN